MWSFEEAVEYHMGDEIRAEKYPHYNKSFVTKVTKSQDDLHIPFGSTGSKGLVARLDTSTSARKDDFLTSSKLQQQQQSRDRKTSTSLTSNNNNKSADTMSVKSSTTTTNRSRPNTTSTTAIEQHKQEVTQLVKERRMKMSDLVREISIVRQQTNQLQIQSKHDYHTVQQAILQAEKSDNELQQFELQAINLVAKTRQTVLQVLNQKQQQQKKQILNNNK
jgi:hypothetical protein